MPCGWAIVAGNPVVDVAQRVDQVGIPEHQGAEQQLPHGHGGAECDGLRFQHEDEHQQAPGPIEEQLKEDRGPHHPAQQACAEPVETAGESPEEDR